MEQLESMEQKLNCEENWKKQLICNGSMQVSNPGAWGLLLWFNEKGVCMKHLNGKIEKLNLLFMFQVWNCKFQPLLWTIVIAGRFMISLGPQRNAFWIKLSIYFDKANVSHFRSWCVVRPYWSDWLMVLTVLACSFTVCGLVFSQLWSNACILTLVKMLLQYFPSVEGFYVPVFKLCLLSPFKRIGGRLKEKVCKEKFFMFLH